MKTSELTDIALDWAVHYAMHGGCEGYSPYEYSEDWAHGGPIIERERLNIAPTSIGWEAYPDHGMSNELFEVGPTPLIAAMRCYVASKLGDDVEIPEELK